MVHIDIPTNLEEKIKSQEQKEYCEKLLVGIDEEIINAYEKKKKKERVIVREVKNQNPPGLSQIKSAFRAELNRRNDAYLGTAGYDPARFTPATRSRPTAGLIDPKGRFVETTQQFALFLENCTDVKPVEYHGAEQMLMIKIPAGYVGKIAYVQRQDIPQSVYDAGRVVSLRREKDNQYMDIVPSLDAPPTDQSFGTLNAEQVGEKYGWVTVKIKDGCLVSWMAGPDIKANTPTTPGEQWALLGPHKRKNNK
jgi:hypothetical protein